MHGFQNARLNVLERDVEIRADVVVFGNRLQQLVGDTFRLNVHNPEPGLGEFVRKGADKPSQARFVFEILTPTSRILGDEHDLLHTLGHVNGNIRANGFVVEAVVPAADIGDGAVRAESVAPVRISSRMQKRRANR